MQKGCMEPSPALLEQLLVWHKYEIVSVFSLHEDVTGVQGYGCDICYLSWDL